MLFIRVCRQPQVKRAMLRFLWGTSKLSNVPFVSRFEKNGAGSLAFSTLTLPTVVTLTAVLGSSMSMIPVTFFDQI